MQSRINPKRNRRRNRWLSPGSVAVSITCFLFTGGILLPRMNAPQPPSAQKPIPQRPIIPPQPAPIAPTQPAPIAIAPTQPLTPLDPGRTLPNPNIAAPKPAIARAQPMAIAKPRTPEPEKTRSISVSQTTIAGIPLYITSIDLTDPKTFIGVGLANQATEANNARSTKGDEDFQAMVKRYRAAVTANGTFFSMDSQKRVMGNMVSGGRFLKYSPWENYGTTLGIRVGNRPEMTTARTEGKPNWNQHWFSLTAGPRLLKQGELSINPKQEGFTDPAVMGVATRIAIGFPEDGKRLLLVTFNQPVSLQHEAAIMKVLGCAEAMNLDGGTSVALAVGDRVVKPAGRDLTNVITIYDAQHPAPDSLKRSWAEFQKSDRVAFKPGEG